MWLLHNFQSGTSFSSCLSWICSHNIGCFVVWMPSSETNVFKMQSNYIIIFTIMVHGLQLLPPTHGFSKAPFLYPVQARSFCRFCRFCFLRRMSSTGFASSSPWRSRSMTWANGRNLASPWREQATRCASHVQLAFCCWQMGEWQCGSLGLVRMEKQPEECVTFSKLFQKRLL